MASNSNSEKLTELRQTFEIFKKNAQVPHTIGTIEQALESFSVALTKLEEAREALQRNALASNREGLLARDDLVRKLKDLL